MLVSLLFIIAFTWWNILVFEHLFFHGNQLCKLFYSIIVPFLLTWRVRLLLCLILSEFLHFSLIRRSYLIIMNKGIILQMKRVCVLNVQIFMKMIFDIYLKFLLVYTQSGLNFLLFFNFLIINYLIFHVSSRFIPCQHLARNLQKLIVSLCCFWVLDCFKTYHDWCSFLCIKYMSSFWNEVNN